MKYKIIVSKGEATKEAVIKVNSSIEGVASRIQAHGWRVDYFEPVEDIHEDEDTQVFEIGRLQGI